MAGRQPHADRFARAAAHGVSGRQCARPLRLDAADQTLQRIRAVDGEAHIVHAGAALDQRNRMPTGDGPAEIDPILPAFELDEAEKGRIPGHPPRKIGHAHRDMVDAQDIVARQRRRQSAERREHRRGRW